MTKRQRAVARRTALDYARHYLDVERLPREVRAQVNAYVDALDAMPESAEGLAAILRQHFRVRWITL